MLIIATGPSLTDAQVQAARPFVKRGAFRVIGVNDAYRICNFLDLLYAADDHWWDYHEPQTRNVPLRVTVDKECADKHGLTHIPGRPNGALSLSDKYINEGNHSGFQALNLAVHMGASDILLLGYDLKVTAKTHWFGEHPDGVRRGNGRQYEIFRAVYPPAARTLKEIGIRVVNCSPDSAISCFPVANIREALLYDPANMAK